MTRAHPFQAPVRGISGQVWLRYLNFMRSRISPDEKLIKPFEGDYVQVDICGELGILLQDAPDCKFPIYSQYYFRGSELGANSTPPEVKIETKKKKKKINPETDEGTSLMMNLRDNNNEVNRNCPRARKSKGKLPEIEPSVPENLLPRIEKPQGE